MTVCNGESTRKTAIQRYEEGWGHRSKYSGLGPLTKSILKLKSGFNDWLIDCHLLFVPLYLTTELETSLGRPKPTLSGDFGSREIRVGLNPFETSSWLHKLVKSNWICLLSTYYLSVYNRTCTTNSRSYLCTCDWPSTRYYDDIQTSKRHIFNFIMTTELWFWSVRMRNLLYSCV